MVYEIKETISTLNNKEYVKVEVNGIDRVLKTPKNTSQETIDTIIDQELKEQKQADEDAEKIRKAIEEALLPDEVKNGTTE
tara:strand:+ start:3645 stop:3887 length:243 start_codon:yes stop_codon:yes gene_type:complete